MSQSSQSGSQKPEIQEVEDLNSMRKLDLSKSISEIKISQSNMLNDMLQNEQQSKSMKKSQKAKEKQEMLAKYQRQQHQQNQDALQSGSNLIAKIADNLKQNFSKIEDGKMKNQQGQAIQTKYDKFNQNLQDADLERINEKSHEELVAIIRKKDAIIMKQRSQSRKKDAIIQNTKKQFQNIISNTKKQFQNIIQNTKKQLSRERRDNRKHKFYSANNYNHQNYEKILEEYSQSVFLKPNKQYKNINQKLKSDKDKRFRQNVEYILTEICRIKTGQIIGKQSGYEGFVVLKVWQYLYQFYSKLINNEKINWEAFILKDQDMQFDLRTLFLTFSFQDCIEIYKQYTKLYTNKENLKKISIQKIYQQQNFLSLTALSVKQSFVYESNQLKNRLENVVTTIKNSSFVRKIFVQYFEILISIEEQFQEKNVEITYDTISRKIEQAQVLFIDYPIIRTGGVTYTHNQKFPIFINLFRFYSQAKERKWKIMQSYVFYILFHQLAHYLLRSIELVKPEENSNPWNTNSNQKQDSGYQFQHFVFGGVVKYCLQSDYQNFQKLLKYNPHLLNNIFNLEKEKRKQNYESNYRKRKQQYEVDINKQKNNNKRTPNMKIAYEQVQQSLIELREYLVAKKQKYQAQIENKEQIIQHESECNNQIIGEEEEQEEEQISPQQIIQYQSESKKQLNNKKITYQDIKELFNSIQQVGTRDQKMVEKLCRKNKQQKLDYICIRSDQMEYITGVYCAVHGNRRQQNEEFD